MAAHRSTKVDMPIRVRHQGQQFIGKLLAVNGPAGLLQAPHPMTVGRPAVLQMVRAENGSAQVQLFAQVVRKHQTPGRYIIGWQKAVSPRGILPILQVLRDPLGIIFNDSAVEEADISDSEMVQYDFRADTISVPHRELVIRRHDEAPADVVASTFARRLAKASFPVNGKPPADAPAEDPESDVVEMYGMTVSRDNWERLENLSYSGSSGENGESPETGGRARPKKAPGHRQTNGAAPQPTDPQEPGKVSRMLRRLADVLAGK